MTPAAKTPKVFEPVLLGAFGADNGLGGGGRGVWLVCCGNKGKTRKYITRKSQHTSLVAFDKPRSDATAPVRLRGCVLSQPFELAGFVGLDGVEVREEGKDPGDWDGVEE